MAIAHVLMTALLDGEQTGYDLARSFDTSLGFFWQATHQQIYAELKKLKDKEWLSCTEISQQSRPNKLNYQLTDLGKQELEAWVYEIPRHKVVKDELLVKLYNLDHKNIGHMIGLLSERRKEAQSNHALYEKIRERHYANPEDLPLRKKGVYLSLLAGIREIKQWIEWCDDSIKLLEQEFETTTHRQASV